MYVSTNSKYLTKLINFVFLVRNNNEIEKKRTKTIIHVKLSANEKKPILIIDRDIIIINNIPRWIGIVK